jgi:isopenicillin N synthase-like dioxygenase
VSIAVLRLSDVTFAAVERAFAESGGFLLHDSRVASEAREMVSVARGFFDLPIEIKRELAIEHSPHFRGWSEMRNERDWREQIHFGAERESHAGEPQYLLLDGPNLWPADPAFRAVVTRYIQVVAASGEHILATIARGLGIGSDVFGAIATDGYHLLKLICYWAQQEPQVARPGVAAHVDFSYLTLTLQDGSGLEARRPDGAWIEIEPLDGAWWIHPGELLQFATCGLFAATPHRVVNRSHNLRRLSMPFFCNPPLTATVPRLRSMGGCERPHSTEHVHHVLRSDADPAPFVFGEAEWRRKGLNRWCVDCIRQ